MKNEKCDCRMKRWLTLLLCLICTTATVRGQTPAPLPINGTASLGGTHLVYPWISSARRSLPTRIPVAELRYQRHIEQMADNND